MNTFIRNLGILMMSKRSTIAMMTVIADLLAIFGFDITEHQATMAVTVITAIGGLLIKSRGETDAAKAMTLPLGTGHED